MGIIWTIIIGIRGSINRAVQSSTTANEASGFILTTPLGIVGSDATGNTDYRSVSCRHPGTCAFLVSACLLRQYGLLPGCLRPASGNGVRLALCPDRQPVPA